MPYLVTDNCVKCKYTDCVNVCPVDCFYEGPNFLAIDPDECIDCALCEPECPAGAIVADYDLSDDERDKWMKINILGAQQWNVISEQKDPLPDAAEHDRTINPDVPDKTHLIEGLDYEV